MNFMTVMKYHGLLTAQPCYLNQSTNPPWTSCNKMVFCTLMDPNTQSLAPYSSLSNLNSWVTLSSLTDLSLNFKQVTPNQLHPEHQISVSTCLLITSIRMLKGILILICLKLALESPFSTCLPVLYLPPSKTMLLPWHFILSNGFSSF